MPGNALPFNIDLTGAEDAALAGDISIPVQSLNDMKLSGLRAAGDSIVFYLDGIPGRPTFRGAVNAALDTVVGEFEQGGQQFRFNMARSAAPAEASRDALAGFDALVNQALTDFQVPGLALVIVRDGQVVMSRGFGYRDVARRLPVTTQTLFEIGSSTKAFTVMLLGQLVDEGRLDWDKPVRTWLPDFALRDPMATEQMTPRDLVTHRSGLPRHDLVWYNSPADRPELFRRLRHLEPNKGFREEFQYNNLMFMTAGYLTERVTGQGWEEQVGGAHLPAAGHDPLPLPRERPGAGPGRLPRLPAQAGPDQHHPLPGHRERGAGRRHQVVRGRHDEVAAGTARRTGGGWEATVQPVTLKEMHSPQMVVSAAPSKLELPVSNYGLGWFIQPYQGHQQVHHGGNIDGFSAPGQLFPNERIGIVGVGEPGCHAARHAADPHGRRPDARAAEEGLAGRGAGEDQGRRKRGQGGRAKKDLARVKGMKPSHPLAEYAGDYANPGYGNLKVEVKGAALQMTYNNIVQSLEHWHYDVFNGVAGAADPVFEDQKIQFTMNMEGDISGLQSVFEPEVPAIIFTKQPDARMLDAAYLATRRTLRPGPTPLTISLAGRQLKVTRARAAAAGAGADAPRPVRGEGPERLRGTLRARCEIGADEADLGQPNGVYGGVQNPAEPGGNAVEAGSGAPGGAGARGATRPGWAGYWPARTIRPPGGDRSGVGGHPQETLDDAERLAAVGALERRDLVHQGAHHGHAPPPFGSRWAGISTPTSPFSTRSGQGTPMSRISTIRSSPDCRTTMVTDSSCPTRAWSMTFSTASMTAISTASTPSSSNPATRAAARIKPAATPRWRAWAGISSVSSGADSCNWVTGISDTAFTPPGRRHPIRTEGGPAMFHYSLGPPWDRTTKVAMASLVPRSVSAR